MNKDIKNLIKTLTKQGVPIRISRKGHHVIYQQNEIIAVIPGTPSDHRTLANIQATLRRHGYQTTKPSRKEKTMNPNPASRVLLALSLTATLLTGCTPTPAPPALTIAVTASSHEPKPEISNTLLADIIINHAKNAIKPGQGTITIVAPGLPPEKIDLTAMRGQEVESDITRAEKTIRERLPRVDQALARPVTNPGTDVLAAYDAAIQNTPPGGHIIILSSGLSTIDPVNLATANYWETRPKHFAETIPEQHIPDATNRHITFHGPGYTAGKQPEAKTATRTALQQLWLTICDRSHAASCTINQGPTGHKPPTSKNPVPLIHYNPIKTRCQGSTALPSDIAFENGSATLSPAADNILKPLAQTLKQCPGNYKIHTIGYASTVPGHTQNDQQLSHDRAKNVLNRLHQLGIPTQHLGTPTGHGSNPQHQPVNNMPDGKYNEDLAALNRIVEIKITTQ